MSLWAIFCTLAFLTTKKIKIWKKEIKPLEILSFYTCVPQRTAIWYMVLEISSATDNFLSFWTNFYPFTPIICYIVLEIWCVTDVIVIFHFGLLFALLLPNSPKNKNFNKMKNHMEISSFFISVPEIMIICHTVPEVWHVTYVIVILHFGLIFSLLHPKKSKSKSKKQREKWKFQKKWKKLLEISSSYTCVP